MRPLRTGFSFRLVVVNLWQWVRSSPIFSESSCQLFFHQCSLVIRSFINLSPNFHKRWITHLKTKALCVIESSNKLNVFPFQCNNGAWRSPGMLPLPFNFNVACTYVGRFKSIVHEFIAVTKYKITKLIICENVPTYAHYSVHSRTVRTRFPFMWQTISCSSVFILAQTM
jgi:hypothetical protein